MRYKNIQIWRERWKERKKERKSENGKKTKQVGGYRSVEE
jgi:hypothetical protein